MKGFSLATGLTLLLLTVSTQALEISADNSSFNEHSGESTYLGQVRLRIDKSELSTVESDKRIQQEQEAILTGNVRLTLNNGSVITTQRLVVSEDGADIFAQGDQVRLSPK